MKNLKVLLILFLCYNILNFCVSPVSSVKTVDSWVDLAVISFDGENILFRLEIYVRGNHVNDTIWVRIEPPLVSGSDEHSIQAFPVVEIWRVIEDVIYYENINVTTFSYFYSYEHKYYRAEPKFFGILLFPFDTHTLTLYISPSFNLTIDSHPKVCSLPSSNYVGRFTVRYTPTKDQPLLHELTLEIKHSSNFSFIVFAILFVVTLSIFALSFLSTVIIWRRKKSGEHIIKLVRVPLTALFFIPTFEIAFYNLKAPLSLVFWDIIMVILIVWNVFNIIWSSYIYYNLSLLKWIKRMVKKAKACKS